ncbi:preprotein translocase subunit YajC [Pseudonocardia thermophila]|uniref:Preprotein translocase subunit YajC n=1 Tax=Pseudonocardia thermophila TaxID=1848 RepID=A0A1M6Z507_PSETH|nr:preprotein translocase subunit YajC [Pseudonocardia thermophila]SHL25568.1 preprotein translocase subunit YajC [Pseudonocardia thermophila]
MDISLFLPLLFLVLLVPLFLQARKQRKQMTEMQTMQNSLTEGDVVITIAGVRGTVVDASYEETVDLEIADGVVTTWLRGAIRQKVTEEHAETHEAETTGEASDAPSLEKPSLEKNDN